MVISQELLKQISENTYIDEELVLDGDEVDCLDDEQIFRLAAALKNNTHIKKINLSMNAVSDAGVEALLEAIPALEELNIGGNDLTTKGAKILAGSQLKFLNITSNPIGDKGAKAFAKNNTLLELWMDNCKLSNKGVREIFRNNTLEKLSLGYNLNLDERAFETLPTNTTLKELFIKQAWLPDSCAGYIAQNKGLKRVNLVSNRFGDRGAKILAENNSTIEELDLSQNKVGDMGVGAFSQNKSVKRLKLYGNKATLEGVKLLSLQNRTLIYLDLSSNGLTDECVKYFSSIKSLKSLVLHNNQITNHGAKFLIRAFKEFDIRGMLVYNPVDFGELEQYRASFLEKECVVSAKRALTFSAASHYQNGKTGLGLPNKKSRMVEPDDTESTATLSVPNGFIEYSHSTGKRKKVLNAC